MQKAGDCLWLFHNEVARDDSARLDLFVCVRCFVIWVLFKLWGIGKLYKGIWKQIVVDIWFNPSLFVLVYSKTDTYTFMFTISSVLFDMNKCLNSTTVGDECSKFMTHKLPELVNIQRPDQLACCLWHCRRSHFSFSLVVISLPKIISF